jgi:hypothetical protein
MSQKQSIWSLPAVTRVLPSRVSPSPVTALMCWLRVARHADRARLHTRTVQSSEALSSTSCAGLGWKRTSVTMPVCPSKLCVQNPPGTSHTFTLRSELPLATSVPVLRHNTHSRAKPG